MNLSSRSSGESSLNSTCNCHATSRLSANERIQQAIDILQLSRLSLLTALIKVLDPSEKDFSVNHARFYACPKDQLTGKLGKLFDQIWGDSQGQSQLHAWMETTCN